MKFPRPVRRALFWGMLILGLSLALTNINECSRTTDTTSSVHSVPDTKLEPASDKMRRLGNNLIPRRAQRENWPVTEHLDYPVEEDSKDSLDKPIGKMNREELEDTISQQQAHMEMLEEGEIASLSYLESPFRRELLRAELEHTKNAKAKLREKLANGSVTLEQYEKERNAIDHTSSVMGDLFFGDDPGRLKALEAQANDIINTLPGPFPIIN